MNMHTPSVVWEFVVMLLVLVSPSLAQQPPCTTTGLAVTWSDCYVRAGYYSFASLQVTGMIFFCLFLYLFIVWCYALCCCVVLRCAALRCVAFIAWVYFLMGFRNGCNWIQSHCWYWRYYECYKYDNDKRGSNAYWIWAGINIIKLLKKQS
jgi:hypothetical protein